MPSGYPGVLAFLTRATNGSAFSTTERSLEPFGGTAASRPRERCRGMLILLSPAKTLDLTPWKSPVEPTEPEFLDDSQRLIDRLRKLSKKQLGTLMNISEKLAAENFDRYAAWQLPFTTDNAKPAVMTFKGDVYQGLEAETFKKKDLESAQRHLRILSGLHGLLRPLDLIQPYRLEMGTDLGGRGWKNLYDFWGTKIAASINEALAAQKDRVVVNLASNEYFKAVDRKTLDAEVVTPTFKDEKDGKLRTLSFFAKNARGRMAAYILKKRLKQPNEIKSFNCDGYTFNTEHSKNNTWVFSRPQPPKRN
jgi:cytoplasmic iron level regulating protein YaaA (DUF328/UPF0246 family)